MTNKSLGEYTKEELIEMVNSLKKQKKFGLVWEDKPEKVATDCEKKLPVLKELSERAINEAGDDEPTNIIIEGDNYHVLSALNYTHAGKIDAIYIDPPYNTGSTTWIYNNKIIDGNDTYRHSKWLSFMVKRLKLAKSLLKETGIIVVTIDDYEIATLKLLMDQIFSEENHLGTVVVKNNPSGRSTASGFSIAHEYALFYGKAPDVIIGRLPRTGKQIARYKNEDDVGRFEWVNFRKHGGYRHESPKMYYPIYIDIVKKTLRIPEVKWNNKACEYDVHDAPGTNEIQVLPIDEHGKERRWKWSIERARNEILEMKVSLDRAKQHAAYIKSRIDNKGMLPLTWWDKTEYSATAHGTNLLSQISPNGTKFDYPKSLYAVMDSVRVLSENKDAVILDFFAGSGTTGHAVMELNKEDGGHRQFILCTNNENMIAEEITYPRIKNVIKGYGTGNKKVDGVSANVRYFKTSFVEKNETLDKLRRELAPACEDMIRIREGAYEQILNDDMLKVYRNIRGLTAIIYDRFELEKYIRQIEELETDTPVHLYVFSYGKNNRSDEMPCNLKHTYENQPIPEGALEIYKRIFTKR